MSVKIYIDANVFIWAFEKLGETSQYARSILDLVRKKEVIAVISELIVAKLLIGPIRRHDMELHEVYARLLDAPDGYELHSVDRNILMRAAHYRAASAAAKLPDAIHIATALQHKCAAFVSNDKRLDMPIGLLAIALDAACVDNIRALA